MKIPSAQLNEGRPPVALAYSRPGSKGRTLLGTTAFAAGLISVVAVVLSVFMADDPRLQNIMCLGSVGGAMVGMVMGILGRCDAKGRGGAGRIDSRNGIILASAGVVLMLLTTVLFRPFVCNYPREPANRHKCAANLRQIGQGLDLYAFDHGGQYPARLGQLISDADLSPEIFVCPSSSDTVASGNTTQQVVVDFARAGRCSYVYLAAGMRKGSIPADFVVAYEDVDHHEKDGANFLFGDGHAEWLKASEAEGIIKQLKAGVNPPK